jgi:uncharacterized protein
MGGNGVTEELKEQLVMEDFISLSYREALTPCLQRFGEYLLVGRIVGHKSPSGNVYVPGRGYDPLTMEITEQADEVEVADTGALSGYTIIKPVAYYGQRETEPFVVGSVLLDGATNAIGFQRIVVPLDEVRAGMRVRAAWKPQGERNLDGMSNRWWGGFECAIAGFEPTGEPDESEHWVREHIF